MDRIGRTVIALTNLSPRHDCHPDQTSGKIAKRHFRDDGIDLNGVVIETSNGAREYVNVSIETDKMDAATKGWVTQGLHTLLAEGRSVEIGYWRCGASGRVSVLHAVR